MDNLFEKALSKGEARQFFEGTGEYFARNREDHAHSYVTHMTGWVGRYIGEDAGRLEVVLDELATTFSAHIGDVDFLQPANMLLVGLARMCGNMRLSIDNADTDISDRFYSAINDFYSSIKIENVDTDSRQRLLAMIMDRKCFKLAGVMEEALNRRVF